jgi:5-enolpyruvylshikimate-3-phosphate synthase
MSQSIEKIKSVIEEELVKETNRHNGIMYALNRIKEICEEEEEEIKQNNIDTAPGHKNNITWLDHYIKSWLDLRTNEELRMIVSNPRVERMYNLTHA